MAHFPIDAWIDFVRNLGPESVLLEMAWHRATCERCHRLALMLEDLAATSRLDKAFAAPDEVVERALRLFDPRTVNRSH